MECSNTQIKIPYIVYGIIIFSSIALFFFSSHHHPQQEFKGYMNETKMNANKQQEELNIMNFTLGEITPRSIDMQIEKNMIELKEEEKRLHDIVEQQIYNIQSIAFAVFLGVLVLIYYYSVIEEQKYKKIKECKEIENEEKEEKEGYVLIDNREEYM
jgi:hypothetical protein